MQKSDCASNIIILFSSWESMAPFQVWQGFTVFLFLQCGMPHGLGSQCLTFSNFNIAGNLRICSQIRNDLKNLKVYKIKHPDFLRLR